MPEFINILPPPRIHHIPYRPKKYVSMIRVAANNIHLRRQARCLLEYYASQREEFSPALALIEARTGIASKKISEVRKRLTKWGLIHYDRHDRGIYISWDRISAFAMLDEPLHIERNVHYTIPPFRPEQYTEQYRLPRQPTIRVMNQHSNQAFNEDILTTEQMRQIKILESMTLNEYNELLDIWKWSREETEAA